MGEDWSRRVADWLDAGVIDAETGARIRAFEADRRNTTRWKWPMRLALAAGGLLVSAGILLFVAAHWDDLSPAWRFATVLGTIALVHGSAAAAAPKSPALSTTLHAVGTLACGAGIFLSGQIFNMAEHWPAGVMLWAAAAVLAWLLLGAWPQAVLSAILVPSWLASEWMVAASGAEAAAARVLVAGQLLLALTYFTADGGDRRYPARHAFRWLGGIWLLPAALSLAVYTAAAPAMSSWGAVSPASRTVAWLVALGAPVGAALVLHGFRGWPIIGAAAWVLALFGLDRTGASLPLYAWWAIGAAALAGWGVTDRRTERINVGAAIFAATVIAFYFSEVMSKLGRSVSLIGLGLLFLGGGWALERTRRRLVLRTKEVQ